MAARDWLVSQRHEIWRKAQPKADGGDGGGWAKSNRSARYAQLSDDSLNNGEHAHEYALPANGSTDTEKAYVEEREGYLMIGGDGASADDEQKARKTANSDWLVERRQKVYGLISSSTDQENDDNYRHQRYQNLCIATHYGSAWDSYEAAHNKYGQEVHEDAGGGDGSSRAKAVSRARSYLGTSEHPPDSNRGDPQPDGWEGRVYGSSGVPWCSCFATCMAWDAGVHGSSSAGVSQIVSMAKAGQGMFRGWSTDVSQVLHGDLVIISCSTCHVGMCAESGTCHTIEGNTSPGSEGSQFNGGCVAEKHRSRSEIYGFALVDYP